MLERYGHGGDLKTAEQLFGQSAASFLDFSSNMNPIGPPPSVRQQILRYADEIAAYPDPAVRELRVKLADRHRIPEASILVGNGAAELIDLAVRALNPRVTGLARPSFAEYEEAVRRIGGRITDIPLHAEHGYALQERDLASAAATADLLLLGHPNNPTGRLAPLSAIRGLLAEGKRILLDEAFIDFSPDEERLSLIREAAHDSNLLVIRSMTKFYAIPGIRLGYIVAHPDRIAEMRGLQVPWSVNSLAQLIGMAVLEEREYAANTVRWLQLERGWLIAELERLGLKVVPGEANYLLFSIPPASGHTAQTLQHAMGMRGILLRDASRFPGLDRSCCRMAVKQRADNERFLDALRTCMEQA